MKLISLNIWDARIFNPLMDFFEINQEIDIFCLQEVFNGTEPIFFRKGEKRVNGFTEIALRLPDHIGFFAPAEDSLDDEPPTGVQVPYGLAIFVKKGIGVTSHSSDIIFGNKEWSISDDARTHKRIIQSVCISVNDSLLTVSNVHGLWNGKGKTDTPERVEQSNKIKEHINRLGHSAVLAGDFNLLPDTKSIDIVRRGMRDLIKEYNITSTRSKLYTKHQNPVLFADYIFTSPEIEVNDFKVLQEEVSDHLPLYLDFK